MAGVCPKWQERTDQRNMVAAGNVRANYVESSQARSWLLGRRRCRSIAYLELILHDFVVDRVRDFSSCPRIAVSWTEMSIRGCHLSVPCAFSSCLSLSHEASTPIDAQLQSIGPGCRLCTSCDQIIGRLAYLTANSAWGSFLDPTLATSGKWDGRGTRCTRYACTGMLQQ